MKIASLINGAMRPLGVKISRIEKKKEIIKPGNKFDIVTDKLNGMDREVRKILNLLNYTKESQSSYSAGEYDSAYHSIKINDIEFTGQRNPAQRFEVVNFDFSNATVLDLGCNQGGMLFEIADRIRHGIGVDYDSRMINAANKIRSSRSIKNVDFYTFDLEKENLGILHNFFPDNNIDIVFLLSVCMWIKNWKDVISMVASISNNLLFESNGTLEQQEEQKHYLQEIYESVILLQDTSPDDPQQKARILYLCSNN